MFLNHISELGFLQHNPESGVFLGFPDSTRKVIALKLCDDLLRGEPGPEALSSSAHVRVLLELLGQSFGLAIDPQTAVIIGKAVTVYDSWLFSETGRPTPIREDEQVFFKDIFRHFSMIFLPRPGITTESEPHHSKLCLRVLDIYAKVATVCSDRLTRDTWETLLKIVLGIADSLLRMEENSCYLADDLTSKLLEVLVQVYLTSRTNNLRLWDHLTTLMRGWIHRQPTILQWGATALGLSKHVMYNLYGPPFGLDHIAVVLPHVSIAVRGLSKEYSLYVWYRVMHFLRNLEQIPIARNYVAALFEVSKITAFFLETPVGQLPSEQQHAAGLARRNTLLHVVGPWLFDAINNAAQPGFERGKASALQSLCQIFCDIPDSFDPQYLACFYRGIELALNNSENNLLMSTVVTFSESLFRRDMKGSRVLLPSYIAAVRRVMSATNLTGIDMTTTELRRSCIRLLGTFICLPNQFRALPVVSLTRSGENSYQSYANIASDLCEILTKSLATETDPTNQQLILWTSFAFLLEHIDSASAFATDFLASLLSNLLGNDQWTTSVSVTALLVISELAHLDHLLEHSDRRGRMVVSQLCAYIERSMNRVASVSGKEPNEDLIVEPMHAALRWCLAGQWLVTDTACLYQVLNVIDLGLTGKFSRDLKEQVYFAPSERIREAATLFFYSLFFQLGQFPTMENDPAFTSSLKIEADFDDSFATYIFDESLLSIGQTPHSTDVRTNLILRNPMGRFVWHCHLNYFPHPVLDPPPLPPPVPIEPIARPISRVSSHFPVPSMSDPKFEQALLAALSPEQTASYQEMLRLAQENTALDQRLTAEHVARNPVTVVHLPRPALRPGSENDHVSERLFLSHLGLSWLDNRTRICHATSDKIFGELDQQNNRQCLSIGVLFFQRGCDMNNWLSARPTSPDFEDFLSLVGWQVDLSEHRGFTGGLDAAITGPTAPYYADALTEVMFHVAPQIADVPNKPKLFDSEKVMISWIESLDAPLPDAIRNTPVNIVIYPLPSKLYRIRVIALPEFQKNTTGPLLDGMIVSRHILGQLVRRTAVVAHRMFGGGVGTPLTVRTRLIRELIQTARAPAPFHKFLSGQYLLDS